MMMSCGRMFRNKHLVLFFSLIVSMIFVIYQKLNHESGSSTKSKIFELRHFRAINNDIEETYLRFHSYQRFIEKMADEQRKEKIAKDLEFNEDFNKDTITAECITPPFLLIEIHSHPKNFLSRQAIRLSWGNKELNEKRNYKMIFLLGKVKNQTIQQMVQIEARRTGDIVLGDFLDIYSNLYKKMVLGLKWPLENCPAKYILKTDEDCYVNTDILISFLERYEATKGSEPLYMGRKSDNVSVERDPTDSYYVSKDLFPSPTYVPYVSGGGYVFSGFLVRKLYEASMEFPIFPVEDACFGSLMKVIGVQPKNDLRFMPFIHCVFVDDRFTDPLDRPVCEFLGPIIIHGLVPLKQIEMNFHVKLLTHTPMLCQTTGENGWLKSRKICG